MKNTIRNIFLISFLFITSLVKGQNINETIDYINELLKVHASNPLKHYDGEKPFRGYDKINIDSHGKIEAQRYLENETTGKIESKGQLGYAYLKELVIGTIKEVPFDSNVSIYILSLTCKEAALSCVTYQFNNEGSKTQSELKFRIDNYDVTERLKNALNHLLDLAAKEEKFYETDPFK